ncbi:MAG: tetratricopeptide repeat protein [Acidiferrobacteraceae bacterium]
MRKPGRNDPCPCGSGKKFKRCCGFGGVAPIGAYRNDVDQVPSGSITDPATVVQATARALEHHRAGRLREAESVYREILERSPRDANAYHNLGCCLHDARRPLDAIVCFQKAVALQPDHAQTWLSLGNTLNSQGKAAEAIDCFRKALAARPEFTDAHYNLGCVLQNLGRQEQALAHYQQALTLSPSHPQAHNNAGSIFHAQGRLGEAVASYRRALGLRPDYVDAHYNLGCALQAQGALDEAVAHYRQVLDRRPDHSLAWLNLGNTYKDLGQLDEAVRCYEKALALAPSPLGAALNLGAVLKTQRRFADSVNCYRNALARAPDCTEAHYGLGCVLQEQGLVEEAIACYEQAIILQSSHREAHLNLGNALRVAGRLGDAMTQYRRALDIDPDYADAHYNLGTALQQDGDLSGAIACYKAALALQPSYVSAHNNLLFSLNYLPDADPQFIYAAHLEFGHQHDKDASTVVARRQSKDTSHARRLRIGYVSADFRAHALAYFIEPVLTHHNRRAFEVFCYYNGPTMDKVSHRLESQTDHWVPIAGLSDTEVVRRIRDDGIDLLVDLAGHTGGNRLLVFADRAAPVQVTWLGYLNTTGLQAVDYRITDAHVCPPGGAELLHTEALVRLPHSQWCYEPPENCPAVNAPPCATAGYVTFGSFHNGIKINERVIDLWAEILTAVTDARLLVAGTITERRRGEIVRDFATRGVTSQRITFSGQQSFDDYLLLHHRVDLNLDTFPYTGGTTTCHSLWMGVPVITVTGQTLTSRSGASLLSTVGLPDLIATSPAEYVHIATRLAGDTERMTQLRTQLRARVAESPLTDAPRFTRDLEEAYHAMWERHGRG